MSDTRTLIEAPFEHGQQVTHLQVPDISCPKCGGPVEYVNDRPPGVTGYGAMVLLRCPGRGCPTWELRVEWVTCGKPPIPPAPLEEAYPTKGNN